MWLAATLLYLADFLSDAADDARPASTALRWMYDAARVWTTVTSQVAGVKQNNDSVSNVLRKAIAFPHWSTVDSHWNRNTVSCVSPVTAVMRMPSSCMKSTESWFHAPAVLTATGKTSEWWTAHHIWSLYYDYYFRSTSPDSSKC